MFSIGMEILWVRVTSIEMHMWLKYKKNSTCMGVRTLVKIFKNACSLFLIAGANF